MHWLINEISSKITCLYTCVFFLLNYRVNDSDGNEATSPMLLVTVTDINDNPPVFGQTSYSTTTSVKFAQGILLTPTSLFFFILLVHFRENKI